MVSAIAFNTIGDFTGNPTFGTGEHFANMAEHAAVGCAMAMASRDKYQAGALSGAAGSFAGPPMHNLNDTQQFVAHTVVGGTASVLGGGKFANGAATGAFGYLFNHFLHKGRNVVNPWDVGNDAHRTLQDYADQFPNVFTEQWSDGQGTFFPGRPDIGDFGTRELW